MSTELARPTSGHIAVISSGAIVPAVIADAGDRAARRFVEFSTATIRNPHTRKAYARAAGDFSAWCQPLGLALPAIEPLHVAAYVELITAEKSAPTVEQHLAAIRMLFDWLVTIGLEKPPHIRPNWLTWDVGWGKHYAFEGRTTGAVK
jgi:hypothetical protein